MERTTSPLIEFRSPRFFFTNFKTENLRKCQLRETIKLLEELNHILPRSNKAQIIFPTRLRRSNLPTPTHHWIFWIISVGEVEDSTNLDSASNRSRKVRSKTFYLCREAAITHRWIHLITRSQAISLTKTIRRSMRSSTLGILWKRQTGKRRNPMLLVVRTGERYLLTSPSATLPGNR